MSRCPMNPTSCGRFSISLMAKSHPSETAGSDGRKEVQHPAENSKKKGKIRKIFFFLTSRFWLLQVKRFPGKLLATFVASCSSVASCLDAGPGQITHRRSPKVAWSPGLRPVGPIPVAITAPPRRREPPNPESPCSTDLVGESLTSPSFSGRSGGRSSGTACFGGSATGVLDELITCRQAHGLGARRGTRDEGSREKGKSMEVLLSMRAFAMVFPIIDMCLFCCFFSWMCSMNQR